MKKSPLLLALVLLPLAACERTPTGEALRPAAASLDETPPPPPTAPNDTSNRGGGVNGSGG